MIRWILVGGAAVLVLLLFMVRKAASSLDNRKSRISLLFVVGLAPCIWLVAGIDYNLDQMKRVEFCGGCHSMEPFRESTGIEESEAIAALHYQNNRVPKETACYTCHADHRVFVGPVLTKLNGLRQAFIEYILGAHDTIESSKDYPMANCLHCHGKAKNFLEMHEDELESFRNEEQNCSACHELAHEFMKKEATHE